MTDQDITKSGDGGDTEADYTTLLGKYKALQTTV